MTGGIGDRVAHARRADGGEIVRYDRAGKWYIEWPAHEMKQRRLLTLQEAVNHGVAAENETHGCLMLGRYGGQRFGALVRRHPDYHD